MSVSNFFIPFSIIQNQNRTHQQQNGFETYQHDLNLLKPQIVPRQGKKSLTFNYSKSINTKNFNQEDATVLAAVLALAAQNDVIQSPLANNPKDLLVEIIQKKNAANNDLLIRFQNTQSNEKAILRLTYTGKPGNIKYSLFNLN